ncbi:unnamed protein product, partial [Rotaria magnacalcarata]
PLNYAILRTPGNSKFRGSYIQTTGFYNNINIHEMFRQLSRSHFKWMSSTENGLDELQFRE